jgi:hypothetical protein
MARDKALEILNRDYKRASEILRSELTGIMEQFNDVKYQLFQREKELLKAYDTIRNQEVIITEL